MAKALWTVAKGSDTPLGVLANELGHTSTKSSALDSKLALLKGLGITQTVSGNIKLSPLGRDLVQEYDPEKRRLARVKAMVTLKAYRELVDNFVDQELPPRVTLAAKLEHEYAKKKEFAEDAANAFLDSIEFAKMLDANGVLRRDGVAAAETVVDEELTAEEGDAAAEELDDAQDREDAASDEFEDSRDSGRAGGGTLAPRASLAVTLDLSNFAADDVIQILVALGLAQAKS
ncbi:hypothetical protein O2W18_04930 [Modestobacter sp. VKM Ac-2983]|uniref:hypothetical protein n=1 Tax=Modestobacter sp. VKM Ac-2983 TaxID=3004137 RepID=UPI0022ABB368|nr:hypothetical protein [Modestobacter sp. VKM Ac-2983]MCZ2804438.1 hypothetical protein [Modestobacter sp. VKM Ac-2983]